MQQIYSNVSPKIDDIFTTVFLSGIFHREPKTMMWTSKRIFEVVATCSPTYNFGHNNRFHTDSHFGSQIARLSGHISQHRFLRAEERHHHKQPRMCSRLQARFSIPFSVVLSMWSTVSVSVRLSSHIRIRDRFHHHNKCRDTSSRHRLEVWTVPQDSRVTCLDRQRSDWSGQQTSSNATKNEHLQIGVLDSNWFRCCP